MAPTTEAIRETVLLGFHAIADAISEVLGEAPIPDEAVLADFDEWLDGERAVAYQRALEDVQKAISENGPIIPGETVLHIVNPYYNVDEDRT